MDRRQRKSREAIFNAFISLLSTKHYNKITVGEIIEIADVGRATFYSHFETKDFLLKELCAELFDHIFNVEKQNVSANRTIFDCDNSDDVFLHLFKHIKKNDNNLLSLLSSSNNEIFLGYFKENLLKLCEGQLDLLKGREVESLPEDFRVNHIASVFVEVLKWWIDTGLKESEKTITEYFYTAL